MNIHGQLSETSLKKQQERPLVNFAFHTSPDNKSKYIVKMCLFVRKETSFGLLDSVYVSTLILTLT